MVLEGHHHRQPEEVGEIAQRVRAVDGVLSDDLLFLGSQLCRFGEKVLRNSGLADVVKQRGDAQDREQRAIQVQP